ICQGQQVFSLWPAIFARGLQIAFAYSSFKWANLASRNAGVTVVIVGLSRNVRTRKLYTVTDTSEAIARECEHINAYLVPFRHVYIDSAPKPSNGVSPMDYGSKPADGGYLVLSVTEKQNLVQHVDAIRFVLPYTGSTEFIDGKQRFCLWIDQT